MSGVMAQEVQLAGATTTRAFRLHLTRFYLSSAQLQSGFASQCLLSGRGSDYSAQLLHDEWRCFRQLNCHHHLARLQRDSRVRHDW